MLTSEGCGVFNVFNRKEQIPKGGVPTCHLAIYELQLESSVVLTSEGCRVLDVFNRKEQIPKGGGGCQLVIWQFMNCSVSINITSIEYHI